MKVLLRCWDQLAGNLVAFYYYGVARSSLL